MSCELLDELSLNAGGKSYSGQITYVKDRPGHDRRYAIDVTLARAQLGWTPLHTLQTALRKAVQWYLDNVEYWRPTAETQTRLGLGR